jgi:colanic acid/amylovoran biosynthesis glycosyltransferase
MRQPDRPAVGYVVKRYPRYSETFVVTEILEHEAAGIDLEIFALRPPCDTHFQDAIARVRAPVTYLLSEGVRTSDFWTVLQQAARRLPCLWPALGDHAYEDSRTVYQAALLAQHVADRGITHLHAHFATSATSVARLAARMAGVPYSFTSHAKDIYGSEVRADDLRNKLADAVAVVTVSEYNLTHLRRTYGTAASCVMRIYNGLPLDEFPYSVPDARKPVILSVGRLVEKKGLTDLVDACALLTRTGQPFTCHIIGAGPLDATLRDQIERLGLAARVRLLGPRPRVEVVRRLRQAAVFAAPCVVSQDGDRDGLPTVLLEAMAVGTPCVATAVTGIPEVIQDNSTGLLVAEHDPPALATALEQLLVDRDVCIRLATAARALIERSFDAQRNAAQIRHCFHMPQATLVAVPEAVR